MYRRDSLLTWLINWQFDFGLQACDCIKCLDLILWIQALRGLRSIPSLLRSNVEVWLSKITLGSGFPGSMVSCFHSRRHSCLWYHDAPRTGDLKLTRYYLLPCRIWIPCQDLYLPGGPYSLPYVQRFLLLDPGIHGNLQFPPKNRNSLFGVDLPCLG